MGGGLIQLATKGAQDVYLTGQPSVTFFKTVYKNPVRNPKFIDKEIG